MKQLVMGLLIGILLLTACGGTSPAAQLTPATDIVLTTSTPSPIPTATRTSIPSATPTASITPLPAIPTFTPTFDVSTIVTVTPAPKAECLVLSEKEFAQSLVIEYKSRNSPQFIDLTNDGISEIIIDGNRENEDAWGTIFVFTCQKASYVQLFSIRALEYPAPIIGTIKDLNKNGILEIVTARRDCGGFGSCWIIRILEWDGVEFTDLADEQINDDISPWFEDFDFRDTDNNGTIEVIVKKGLPSHPDSLSDGPWRKYTEIYSWNGKAYVRNVRILTPPQFRFQAIQDADMETIAQHYDVALSLYQEAIFSDKLEWWSIDRHIYYRNNIWESVEPTPLPDLTEYPRLAAYAYYRIMLLHLAQGYESDAGTVYNTLQEKFGSDPYGRPYAEMATAFWEAYQSTRKMYNGCAAAIQYAAEHPEILESLGETGYHGAQSHTYVPADVCPFR